MSVFHRSSDGFEHTEANRREVLMAAGGLAAATAIAANTGHVADKKAHAAPHITVTIDDSHFTAFEALAFSWGASNSGTTHTGGGAGAGKANVQDVSFTKYVDANTPPMFLAVVTGRHFPKMTLTWVGAKGAPTVKITMEEVLITSVSEGGSTSEQRLTENVSVNFSKVTLAYDAVTVSYDIAANV